MRFDKGQDVTASEVQRIIAAEGPEAVLEGICGLSKESRLWDLIPGFYNLLNKDIDFTCIMELADDIKRKRTG